MFEVCGLEVVEVIGVEDMLGYGGYCEWLMIG